MKSSSWVDVIVGIWLIIAAFALPHVAAATASDFVIGILLIAFSFWMLSSVQTQVPAVLNILCGIWLIIAPFVLAYRAAGPTWNDVVCGIIALIAAAAAMRTVPRTRTVA